MISSFIVTIHKTRVLYSTIDLGLSLILLIYILFTFDSSFISVILFMFFFFFLDTYSMSPHSKKKDSRRMLVFKKIRRFKDNINCQLQQLKKKKIKDLEVLLLNYISI